MRSLHLEDEANDAPLYAFSRANRVREPIDRLRGLPLVSQDGDHVFVLD